MVFWRVFFLTLLHELAFRRFEPLLAVMAFGFCMWLLRLPGGRTLFFSSVKVTFVLTLLFHRFVIEKA